MIEQYFTEVESYLTGVPASEQEEMLQFYKEQVIESGMTVSEMEAKYGTPKQFARTIRLEYFMDMDDALIDDTLTPQERTKQRTRMIWLIVLGLFASPILIPVAIAVLFIIAMGLFFFICALLGIYGMVVGTLAGGVASLVFGGMLLTQSIPTAIFFMGLGLLLTGLTIAVTPIVLNLTRWMFEMFVKFMKWIGRRFVSRRDKKPVEGGQN